MRTRKKNIYCYYVRRVPMGVYNSYFLLWSHCCCSTIAGYMGVYSGTNSFFDSFEVEVPCATCAVSGPGDECIFSCAPGYTPIGNTTAICAASVDGSTASWVGTPLTCVRPAPVFNNAFRSVPENSVKGTNVGSPLVAFVADPTATVVFTGE